MAASLSGLSLWYFRPGVQSYTPRSHHAIVIFNLPIPSISLLIDLMISKAPWQEVPISRLACPT
ncbi:MAG: hypothetical protein ACI8PW_001671 [Methylophilaceae bacterium]|jgi:hypothetical protein